MTVSEKPLPEPPALHRLMHIRTCKPRAAARKYIRCNLAFDIACDDQETWNPNSPTYGETPPKELVLRRNKFRQQAEIRIVKNE